MPVKNPRDENGPNGYPKDNPGFEAAAKRVMDAQKANAERAREFRRKMKEDLKKRAGLV